MGRPTIASGMPGGDPFGCCRPARGQNGKRFSNLLIQLLTITTSYGECQSYFYLNDPNAGPL
jgi:hypothetical protein